MFRKKGNANAGLKVPEVPANLKLIADEIHRIHESAVWSGQGQFEQLKFWRAMNMVLGLPAAVLAAISGGTGLASDGVGTTPAILALIAAGFGAALTTLNPSRRVAQAQAAANAYLELQTTARQLLAVDLQKLPYEDVRDQLTELTVRRDEVNRTADPPGTYAYWRAKRNLRAGGQTYEQDEVS